MATATAEVLWASLIARTKPYLNVLGRPSTAELLFSFGKWRRYHIPVRVPLRTTEFGQPSFLLPTRMSMSAYLVVTQDAYGTGRSMTYFELKWPHTWTPEGKNWRVRFHAGGPKACRLAIPPTPVQTILALAAPAKKQPVPTAWKPVMPAGLSNIVSASFARIRRGAGYKRNIAWGLYSNANSRPNPERRYNTIIVATQFGTGAYASAPLQVESYYRAYSSVNTPGFRSAQRSKLPVNPYSLDLRRTQDAQAIVQWKQKSGSLTGYQFNAGKTSSQVTLPSPSAPGFSLEMSNLAIRRMIADAELDIQANLAQDVVQYGQVVNMIADSATRIHSSHRALRQGNFPLAIKLLVQGKSNRRYGNFRNAATRGTLSTTKSLASNWLELQYGWKPLLMDIDGSMRSLANYVSNKASYRQVRGSAKKTTVDKGYLTIPSYTTRCGDWEQSTLVSCRYGVRYGISSPLKSFLAQTGFTNPINLAWEILPYSFVVDWFLPIGPYCETLSAWHGLAFIEGFKTQFSRRTTTCSLHYDGDHPGNANYNAKYKGSYWSDQIRVERSKLSSFPSQTLPELKNPFSVTHALNALALVRAAFK